MENKQETLPEGFLLAGRYEALRCIGVGGFGITYLCRDKRLGRKVAVKEYFPRQWAEREGAYVSVKKSSMAEAFRLGMQSFVREAQIMAEFVETPQVVTLRDVLQANDTVYLAMEYLDGVSVGRDMRRREGRPYSPREAAEIALPALEGLGRMHEKGFIHGDVSPGNIMRARGGEVCLIDLGAARSYKEKRPALGAVFLKPEYAAPEQYRTAREGVPRDEGPWTDIYAMGCVLHYLLTGRRLADALSRLEGKDEKAKLPGKWAKLLEQACALSIQERIGSAEELSRRIRGLM